MYHGPSVQSKWPLRFMLSLLASSDVPADLLGSVFEGQPVELALIISVIQEK